MKYAVIGDIHGNLEAFTEVIADANEKGVDEFLCVGDVVGYGANPAECIKQIQELGCITVAGNHDYAACEKTDISVFNEFARSAVEWTRGILSKEEITYLAGLPFTHCFDSFSIVHASFYTPENWCYVFTRKDAYLNFKEQPTDVAFIGHSHVPGIFYLYNGFIKFIEATNLVFEKGIKYLVNVGSVGQPRDNNPSASYLIFDETTRSIEFRRVSYDIKKTQEKILSNGLPEILATRLEWGR